MRKISITAILLIIVTALSHFTVLSHSGRTDSNGGHYNRSTGEYHYHHGLPAHDHEDGICSYSSTNASQKNSRNTSKSDSVDFSDVVSYVFLFIFASPFIISPIWHIGEFIYETCLEKHFPRYKINCLDKKIKEFHYLQEVIYDTIFNLFISDLYFEIPDSYEIGKDNLPKEKGCNWGWGKTFTMYKTNYGTKLHARYKCCTATRPVHVYWYKNTRNSSELFCSKCAYGYTFPDMSWFERYKQFEQSKKELPEKEHKHAALQKEIDLLYKKCNSWMTRAMVFFCPKNKRELQEVNKQYKELQRSECARSYNQADK